MFKSTANVLMCSRIFSIPMTIMSWSIIFSLSLIDFGNCWYGILALLGLCLIHLAANLIDDYVDYKLLIKQVEFNKEEYLKKSQKTKCRYLINGIMSEFGVIKVVLTYFLLAFLIGLFLFCKCGNGVVYYALAGAFVSIIYPFASRVCLSEVVVGLTYGPLLFGSVFYVMCGNYSKNIFILSAFGALLAIILLYIHTVMDYKYDSDEGKKTLANRFSSPEKALVVLKLLLILIYVLPIVMCVLDILDWQVFLVYLTIPIAVDLYRSMVNYANDNNSIPLKKIYHFPMENLQKLLQNGEAAFMIRMYQARNLTIYYSLLLIFAIILSNAI